MKNKKTKNNFYELRKYTMYVNGIVGVEFKLSLKDKLKILFCSGVSVILFHGLAEDER